ncbi:MAG: MarR family transcriptional regulator [Spirochaetia bacterium]|nr:MarR family transcriptional regulator [Spirochaetia bacterium]
MGTDKTEKSEEIREFRRGLRQLERFVMSNVKDNSGCCGVTPSQCHILLKVEEGDISLSRLKEYVGLDKSTLSRTVDGLVQLGLLERREAVEDRRFSSIRLTDRGERFVERLNGECDSYYRPIYEALPEDLRARILDDFKALSDAFLGASEEPRERSCCSVEEAVNG